MRNGILFASICGLCLSACGGDGTSESSSPVNRPYQKVYTIDTFSGEYDFLTELIFSAVYMNTKTYEFDFNNNFSVKYTNTPIFKTEALRYYLTRDGISKFISQQLQNLEYLIGEQSSFDGETLKYRVNNYVSPTALMLSWKYKKIDISGMPIKSDQNNPVHTIVKSPNANIMTSILGIGYQPSDVFPKGSICWQKQSAQNSQEYIEFYPEKIIRHVSEQSTIQKTETWNNISWVQYQNDLTELDRANIKLLINDKTYWGIYHPINESFTHENNSLACDFMNETAFNAVKMIFGKDGEFNPALDTLTWGVWSEQYLKDQTQQIN